MLTLDSDHPSCLLGVAVTYDTNPNHHSQQDAVFAQLLVSGQVKQVISQSESIRSAAGISWKLKGFFEIPSACTSFSVYVGSRRFQSRERTALETKFDQQLVRVGYTVDLVGCEFLQDGIKLSYKVYQLQLYSCSHTDTWHGIRTTPRINPSATTPLRSNPEGRGRSFDKDKLLLRNLLDSPLSKERATELLSKGLCLKDQYQDTNNTEYLDLAIQALDAACASGRGHHHLNFPHTIFCLLLFKRSTLPGGNLFVDDAFDALKGLSSVPSAEAFMALLSDVLLILEEQDRADYATIAFPILTPFLCKLASECSTELHIHTSIAKAAQLATKLAGSLKETLTILNLSLDLPSIQSLDLSGILLMKKSILYIQRFEEIGDPDFPFVHAAIEQARAHVLKHGVPVGDTGDGIVLHGTFLKLSIKFLTDLPLEKKSESVRETALLYQILSDMELKMESEGGDFFSFRHLKYTVMQNILETFLHLSVNGVDRHQIPGEFIQLLYGDRLVLEENDIKFMQKQVLDMMNGSVSGQYTPGLAEDRVHIIIGAMVDPTSVGSHDQITWLRAFFTAPIARALDLRAVALKAYEYVLSKAGFWAFSSRSLELRYSMSSLVRLITADAVSYALDSTCRDHDQLALEWVDQSSSMVWSQLLHLWSGSARLTTVDPKLAERLNILISPEPLTDEQGRKDGVLDWEGVIKDIRKLPGLDSFLRPKTPSEIQSTAEMLGGPLVYFNVNRHSCDALCVIPGRDQVLHIPLPDLMLQALNTTKSLFVQSLKGMGRDEVKPERIGYLVKDPKASVPVRRYLDNSFPYVLGYLWDNVVKPVLDGLSIQHSESESADDLPRIWWCPSGPLASLPLHAAGYYAHDTDDNIMNYVVSSYIPSSSVISQVTRAENTAADFHLLAVANPEGCGLPGTERELSIIQHHITHVGCMTELAGMSATSEAVKGGLEKSPWTHFACHGVQETVLTMNSALILANHTRLTLGEIFKLSLPHAQFAFLSACQTAKGTDYVSDESAHIAAGMLVAGYRSVVGTMWKISDAHAPIVADHFYQRMFEGNQTPNYKHSAFALHNAIKTLRREMKLEFQHWVPFIHFGA